MLDYCRHMMYPLSMIGIYKITNKVNGKMYIGKSIDIERRWAEELNGQVNEHLRRSFSKYGIHSFDFSVIELCKEEELDEKEMKYISLFKSHNKTFGYNKTLGGEGGRWNDEMREKASKRMKGAGNNFYGRHHSEETKNKISEGRVGEKHWHYGGSNSKETRHKQSITKIGKLNPNAKPVYQYKLDGSLVGEYDCVADASKITGIGYSAIKNCAVGITLTAGGYAWSYGEFRDVDYTNKRLKKVRCIETGIVYESISEASRACDIRIIDISLVCRGKRKTCKGLRFELYS
ncbi:MAG: hypothetical protein EOM67_16855 [Spirochaetia bacterium]|nr:hypothetical protein [Spirochaetia bacterium]